LIGLALERSTRRAPCGPLEAPQRRPQAQARRVHSGLGFGLRAPAQPQAQGRAVGVGVRVSVFGLTAHNSQLAAHTRLGLGQKCFPPRDGNRFSRPESVLDHSGPRENDLRSWGEPENSLSSTWKVAENTLSTPSTPSTPPTPFHSPFPVPFPLAFPTRLSPFFFPGTCCPPLLTTSGSLSQAWLCPPVPPALPFSPSPPLPTSLPRPPPRVEAAPGRRRRPRRARAHSPRTTFSSPPLVHNALRSRLTDRSPSPGGPGKPSPSHSVWIDGTPNRLSLQTSTPRAAFKTLGRARRVTSRVARVMRRVFKPIVWRIVYCDLELSNHPLHLLFLTATSP
jgi:hypothetical protein